MPKLAHDKAIAKCAGDKQPIHGKGIFWIRTLKSKPLTSWVRGSGE
jgi:hypothetical protein